MRSNKPMRRLRHTNSVSDLKQRPETFRVLPYVRNVSEATERVLRLLNVGIGHQPEAIICHLVIQPKGRLQPADSSGVIYRVNCLDCPVNYCGMTDKRLSTHTNVHNLAVRRKDVRSHVRNVSEATERVRRPLNLGIGLQLEASIYHFVMQPNGRLPPADTSGVICRVNCLYCPVNYCGMTDKRLSRRMHEDLAFGGYSENFKPVNCISNSCTRLNMNLQCASCRPPFRMPDPVSEGLGYDWVAGLVDNNLSSQNSSTPPSRKPERSFSGHPTHMINKAQHLSDTSRATHSFLDDHISNFRRKLLESPCEKVVVCNYTLNSRLFPIPADFLTASMAPPSPNTCRILTVSIPLRHFRHPIFFPRRGLDPDSNATAAASFGCSLPNRSRESEQLPGGASLLANCWPNKCTRPRVTLASETPRSTAASICRSISLRSAVNDPGCSPDASPSLPSWMRLQAQSESEILDELFRSSQVMRKHGALERAHQLPSRLRPIRSSIQRNMCAINTSCQLDGSDQSVVCRL
ncbi:unnamed protein product [Schistocephalus solidus]|uniref:C2H2-type domain-containing protein n=1 Tax=Schistocephalus solidus TaxID=70667 RepID=A0A183SF81_SCHSO|nr:unnamed protein product [Schistocephalus solidus]